MARRASYAVIVMLILLSGCAKTGEEGVVPREMHNESPEPEPVPKLEKPFSELEKTHFSREGMSEEAHWVRWWVIWGDVERERGSYDFAGTDLVIKEAGEEGILLLITVMPFAEWDQEKCHGDEYYGSMPTPVTPLEFFGKMPMPPGEPGAIRIPPPGFAPPAPGGELKIKVGKPCNMADYRDFIKKFVERYDGDGIEDMPGLRYPVKYWEIMNEPGLQGRDPSELKFFHGTPEEYLEILKASYSAIKEADPEAKVVMGGMAGMHGQFVEFWEPIIDEAGSYFDIANIHSIDTDERREDLFVLKFKRFLKKHGVEKPIWVTEAQFGPLEFEQEKRKLGEEEMNRLLVRATVLSLALGAEKIFFVSDNWYKSTFSAYETLAEKLNRFHSVEVVEQRYVENREEDAGVTSLYGCYRFRAENKTIYVAWGEGRLSQCVEGRVRVMDIYGKERAADAGEVVLAGVPIYAEVLGF